MFLSMVMLLHMLLLISSKIQALAASPKYPRIPVLVYEDAWTCVSKPAGMTVHAGQGRKHNHGQATVKSRVKRQLARKVWPVHRLDHKTSGALLFAFDSETCGQLHEELRNAKKQYVALLRGSWKFNENVHIVNKPLQVKGIVKEACTMFRLLASQQNATLILAEPQTGRTHQIRRHARAMGHPVLGDSQHGDSHVNRQWRSIGLDRLALHCFSLDNIRGHNIVAPLPLDFKSVLQQQPLWHKAIQEQPRLTMEQIDKIGGSFGRHYRKRKRQLE